MAQKSCSLPKLNRQARECSQPQSPSRKINNDIHKVKWSMSPKCLLEGHGAWDILYACLHPNCQEPTRLVCEACFFKSHQKHNQQFLAIDEIRGGEIERLRYWPFEQRFRQAFEFVSKHESYVSSMIKDVNATFHGMAVRILSSLDKIRLSLLKTIDNFYLKQSTKKEFCQKVKVELERCFELRKIRQTVRSLFSKEIKHGVFQTQMRDVLNDSDLARSRDRLHDYFFKTQKGTGMTFDKMWFLKKESWIIEQIEEQKKTLRATDVTVAEEEIGIKKMLPQTLAYLHKSAEGHYPLSIEKKQLEDGSEYIGFEEKGVRAIFGMRKYPKTGFTYYGEWRIGAKNGWGVLENKKTGYRYSGYWKEDKKNGYWNESLTSTYEGDYAGNRKEGFGILAADGQRYEIAWKNDKMNGAGKRVTQDGEELEVYYLNGVQSKTKSGKAGLSPNLKELTKRFGSTSAAGQSDPN